MGCSKALQAGGLHIELGCGKERVGGLFCPFMQLALLSSSVQPTDSSRFSFANTAL